MCFFYVLTLKTIKLIYYIKYKLSEEKQKKQILIKQENSKQKQNIYLSDKKNIETKTKVT